MTKIGILEGSLRRASLSRAAARAAAGLVPDGVEAVLLPNPGSLPLFNQDILDDGMPDAVAAMIAAVEAVDALLIVTPEYNWSIPGGLKNAIDWVSRVNPNPLERKPVAIWSVSPGLLGGARVHESLRQTLHSQGTVIMAKPEVQIGVAKSKVDVEAGTITHADTEAFLRGHLTAFDAFCKSGNRA
ncbi:NADPH-dependent FMN reductase [Poseidonocella sedimentorum]|uniref:NAD(P)H-dependent FMN reductase n=1 Tax=Poseidonocella sedimentorum TaxID=871652 RepID=A0A1I6DK95_9RHOB|nr:NADPH-dependent FMN reductase [Poseidonocella sedimentorum]SFR05870.1 NAD(P)H-dependent FMN reductase [Poseidonocella sedimentorum]